MTVTTMPDQITAGVDTHLDVSVQLLPPGIALADGSFDEATAHSWDAHVAFFSEWTNPPWSVVLGQVGFFDQFTVTFNRAAQALAITALEDFDERFPQPPAISASVAPRFSP